MAARTALSGQAHVSLQGNSRCGCISAEDAGVIPTTFRTSRTVEALYLQDSRDLLQEIIVDGGYNGSGNGASSEYDKLGRKTAEEDAIGNRVEYQYDLLGNLVTTLTPTAGITQYYYDANSQLAKTIDPLNQEVQYQYDNNGNLVWQRDEQGNETKTYYDALNRQMATEDALGATTYYDYDAVGNVVGITDPRNGRTVYEYNLSNQQTKVTRPLLTTVYSSYTYDTAGNLSATKDFIGQKVTYEAYNPLGKPTLVKVFSATDDVNPLRSTAFAYDANGNLESYTDKDANGQVISSSEYTYDDLGRKTGGSVDYGAFTKGYSVSFPDGWQTVITGPDNVPVTYDYDAAGRLATIAKPGGTMVGYGYDNHHWNNPVVATLPGGSSIGYDYDPRQRVESIVAGKGSQEIMSRVLGYSPAGNILSKNTEHGNYTYGYDDVYRLQTADNAGSMTDEAYTYDNAGNRVSSLVPGTWTYNKNNELTVYPGASSILYDKNGSLTRRTISGVQKNFVYDGENRLASVKNASLAILAEYGYDPFGRRLWKKVGTSSRVYYFYSDEGLIGEYDEAGNELRSYGYIPGSQWSSNPVFVKDDGEYYFYLNDHLGTPQKIIDTNGTVVWSAVYDSFGKAVVNVETITNNLRLPGQYYDSETYLHYNWHRYYDPSTGRYLQADPLGQSAGVNLYAYVNSNPLGFADPEGLVARKSYSSSSFSSNYSLSNSYSSSYSAEPARSFRVADSGQIASDAGKNYAVQNNSGNVSTRSNSSVEVDRFGNKIKTTLYSAEIQTGKSRNTRDVEKIPTVAGALFTVLNGYNPFTKLQVVMPEYERLREYEYKELEYQKVQGYDITKTDSNDKFISYLRQQSLQENYQPQWIKSEKRERIIDQLSIGPVELNFSTPFSEWEKY